MSATASSARWDWRLLFAVPLGAAAVHIFVTLNGFADPAHSALARLAGRLELNRMVVLPAFAQGGQPLPFLGADAGYAMCRFDTSSGPVVVAATLPDDGWTLGVYDADGTSLYFTTAAPGRPAVVNLALHPADDRFTGLTEAAGQSPAVADRAQTLLTRTGIVVIRAPDRGAAYKTSNEAVLGAATCSQASGRR